MWNELVRIQLKKNLPFPSFMALWGSCIMLFLFTYATYPSTELIVRFGETGGGLLSICSVHRNACTKQTLCKCHFNKWGFINHKPTIIEMGLR